MADENQNPENPFADFRIDPPKADDNPFARVENEEVKPPDNPFAQPEAEPVREQVEVQEVEEKSPADNLATTEIPMPESFGDELWGALSEAGISKKKIFGFLVTLAILFTGLYYLFFGDISFNFDFLKGNPDEKPQQEEQEEPEVEEPEIEPVESGQSDELENAYIFGEEFEGLNTVPITYWGNIAGLEANFNFGYSDLVNEAGLNFDLALVTKMENAFGTDIYLLLNQTTERREVLDQHIAQLEQMLVDGDNVMLGLNGSLLAMEREFDLLEEEKVRYEELFFDALERSQATEAYGYYDRFLSLSYELTNLEADYRTKGYLLERFDNVVYALRPRLRDIKANYEALIKGVRVFEVQNSNIKAIIPLE